MDWKLNFALPFVYGLFVSLSNLPLGINDPLTILTINVKRPGMQSSLWRWREIKQSFKTLKSLIIQRSSHLTSATGLMMGLWRKRVDTWHLMAAQTTVIRYRYISSDFSQIFLGPTSTYSMVNFWYIKLYNVDKFLHESNTNKDSLMVWYLIWLVSFYLTSL